MEKIKLLILSIVDVVTSILALIITIITIFIPRYCKLGEKIQKLIENLKEIGRDKSK